MAKKPDRRSAWLRGGDRVASLALTLGAFAAYASAFGSLGNAQEALALAFLCCLAGSFVSTFVHELGHAVVALACGWRVVTFVVRPIGVHLVNLDIAWIGGAHPGPELGWVLSVPRRRRVDTPARWAAVIGAGPGASLLLAAIAAVPWLLLLRPDAPYPSVAGRLCLGLAVQALNCGLRALFGDEQGSDGRKLRTPRERGTPFSALAWIDSLLNANVRLRDLPPWLIETAREATEEPERVARHLAALEIGIVLDSFRVDAARARSLIDAFRLQFGGDPWLDACDAYLAAIWEGEAEPRHRPVVAPDMDPHLVRLGHAALAAVAVRRGDAVAARRHLKAMKAAVRRASPFPNRTYRDIARQVRKAMREAKRAQRASQAATVPSSAGPPFRTKRLSQ
ncbi:MAG: hypothetical protein JO013_13540 [Alphaproteobacteria bacterium]|nr:hypothetical protein [Alphaproteobacteria bacterium]